MATCIWSNVYEYNKLSLSKYLAHKQLEKGEGFTVEAQFVSFFKQIPSVYETIRKIYLGSIIAGYIEYKTENVKTDIELLLDTNFILGVLDLNTPESTHTCRKIMETAKEQGYKLSVLRDTLNETNALLRAKSDNFNQTFLQKKLCPEDIYNACDRRSLNSADLERIVDNVERDLACYSVSIIYDTSKYKNQAKFSNEYEAFKRYRHSEASALHDATAIYYVREKRKKKIKEFENVNCWFLNNSVTRDKYNIDKGNTLEYQPELIKADDFLNIIWLSNPQIGKTLDINEISEIGLTSLISAGLTSSLPKLSIIKELDDNIHKYVQDSSLTDADVVRVATRITTNRLVDIDNLNKVAKENKEFFVQRLNEEAKKQKELDDERIRKLDKILNEVAHKSDSLNKLKSDFEKKSKSIDEKIFSITGESLNKDIEIVNLNKLLDEERKMRKKEETERMREKRETYINDIVRKWKQATNLELLVWLVIFLIGLIWLLKLANWRIQNAFVLYEELKANILFSSLLFLSGFIFTGITVRKWYDKNHNHSNIENYKKGLKLPKEFNERD